MEGKSSCSNYQIDMTAAEFGACKNCGLKKLAHNMNNQTPSTSKGGEGGIKEKMKMFNNSNAAPKQLENKPKEVKHEKPPTNLTKKEAQQPKPAPKELPKPVTKESPKEHEKKSFGQKFTPYEKEEDSDTKNACSDFKIDVAATEFNTCKNCGLHRRFHGAPGSTSNTNSKIRPSADKKEQEKREQERKDQERKDQERKDQERKEKERKEKERKKKDDDDEDDDSDDEDKNKKEKEKKELERKKEIAKKKEQEKNDSDDNKACSNFLIDVTANEFNTCKNCHLHRKFHNAQALSSGVDTKPSGDKFNEKYEKFNKPTSQPVGPQLVLQKSKTTFIRQSETKKPEDSEEPANRASLKPSQSIEIQTNVLSVKDRMKLIMTKPEVKKENVALKEIKQAGSNSVKDLGAHLTNLGLFVPKPPPKDPNEESQQTGLEQIPENSTNEQPLDDNKTTEPLKQEIDYSANLEKPIIQKKNKTISKKPIDFEDVNEGLKSFNTVPSKPQENPIKPPMEQPKPQYDAPIGRPINNSIFAAEEKKEAPKPEIKKEVPKPVEVKKDPPKPEIKKEDNGIFKENPAQNLGAKKKQLFSDSDSDNSDSDNDDPIKKELKAKLARNHSKKFN